VRSLTSASFWKLYAKLPADVRSQARKAYQLWFKEPYHPSLQFKNLQGGGGFCSVRINQQYRAVGISALIRVHPRLKLLGVFLLNY